MLRILVLFAFLGFSGAHASGLNFYSSGSSSLPDGFVLDDGEIVRIDFKGGGKIQNDTGEDLGITPPTAKNLDLNNPGGNTAIRIHAGGIQERDHLGNGGSTLDSTNGYTYSDPVTTNSTLTIQGKLNTGTPEAATISATGLITAVNGMTYTVYPFSGTADDLDGITGLAAGEHVCLEAPSGNTITIRYNENNFYTAGQASRTLAVTDRACYTYNGTNGRLKEEDQS